MRNTNMFDKKIKKIEFLLAVGFIIVGVVLRLLPHPPNFSPIAAVALFGAVYLSRKTAFLLPIAAMIVSDVFLGFYEPTVMAAVYISFLLCVIVGLWIKKHKSFLGVVSGSVLAGVLFFLITNLAVWLFTAWYAKTLAGLVECYTLALPFFRNTLLGDIFYTGVFFGTYEIIKAVVKKRIASARAQEQTN